MRSTLGFSHEASILAILLVLSSAAAGASGTGETTPNAAATERIDRPAVVDSLDQVNPLIQAGNSAQAEALLRRLLERNEQEFGASSDPVGQILDHLVACLWRTGRSQEKETIRLADRAVVIKTTLFGPDHPQVATSLFSVGVIRAMAGDYAGAEPIFERVLRIREATLPPDHHEIASSINALANIRFARSDFAGSLPLYERSLDLAEKKGGPLHPIAVSVRGNIANTLIQLGDYTAARSILEEQIALLEREGMETEDLGFAYSLLANISTSLGDFEDAIPMRERCLRIRLAFHGESHPRTAESLLNLGNDLWSVGRLTEARTMLEQAKAVWEGIYGPEHTHISAFHEGLGRLAYEEGDLAESRQHHERALAIREATMGADHPRVAEPLRSLGRIAMREGHYADACAHLARAIQIVTGKLGNEHTLASDYGIQLARAEFLNGDLPAAAAHAIEAERTSREHLRVTSRALSEREALRYAANRAAGLDLLATILTESGDSRLAIPVWDALIRSRALVFDEMAARGRDLALAGDPLIAERLRIYRQTGSRLANLYIRGPEVSDPDGYREMLEDARRALDDAERELATASGSFKRIGRSEEMGWEEMRRSLPANSAIVAYLLYRREIAGTADDRDPTGPLEYAAFVLRSGESVPVHVGLGEAREIDARIAAWRQEVSRGTLRSDREPREAIRAYRDSGGELRAAIWDPIAPYLEGARRAFVVPDGEIHLVNLATLPTEADRYLIEADLTFHHLSSEREIARRASDLPLGIGALVLGAPDFDDLSALSTPSEGTASADRVPGPASSAVFRGGRPDCDGLRAVRFEPLPGSLVEAERIATLWAAHFEGGQRAGSGGAAVRLLTGTQATETALKQLAPGRKVLHLATHGYFLGDECPSGRGGTRGIGLLLSDADELDETLDQRAPRNPLLLSGLALAGVNQRDAVPPDSDDGILTAQEIAALDLSSVEYAVLSACESGVGEILNGEGIFGLRRAFRVAGTQTLITSLWSIRDEETRLWMDSFYRATLERKIETIEAVREASLETLRTRRQQGLDAHPFYWGAFIASGDWR